MACQLDLFYPEDKNEIETLRGDVLLVKESSDKVRKSLFARHAELTKKYHDLSERMQLIERYICRPPSLPEADPMRFQS